MVPAAGLHRVEPADLRGSERLPDDVFLASDTTRALLSDLPSKGASTDVLPFADAEGTLRMGNALTRGGSSRLLLQNVLAPNFGPLAAALEEMTRNAETGEVSAFNFESYWDQPRDMVAVSRFRAFHIPAGYQERYGYPE